jgi:VIT1/CCC1 family predicted Fe2+/Mn2+ transporter
VSARSAVPRLNEDREEDAAVNSTHCCLLSDYESTIAIESEAKLAERGEEQEEEEEGEEGVRERLSDARRRDRESETGERVQSKTEQSRADLHWQRQWQRADSMLERSSQTDAALAISLCLSVLFFFLPCTFVLALLASLFCPFAFVQCTVSVQGSALHCTAMHCLHFT